MIRRLLPLLCFLGLLAFPAHAQTTKVVATCGSPPVALPVGQVQFPTQDTNGNTCTNATLTPPATQDVNLKQVNGSTVTVGTGTGAAGTQRVTVSSDSSITANPAASTSTDISGTVTLGGTYQTVLASSGTRKGCLIQNPTTATEVLSIKVGTMASPFTVPAGATFSCGGNGIVVTDTITLTAATTAHAFAGISQ